MPSGANINHADAVMRIEYRDAVVRANCEPMAKRPCITREKRMQDERGKREVVNPIHLARDFHLLQVVTVNFDQDLDPQRMGLTR